MMQRYILMDLLRVFGLLVAVLTAMLVFVGVTQQASENNLGGARILQIMPFVVPSMLPFTIPATLLLSVTVVYGRIAGDLEVTAIKAAGISPLRLLTPAFMLGLLLAFCSFALTNYTTPWAIGRVEAIVAQAIEDIFLDMLESQHYISRPEQGYSITVQGVEDRELVNPTFRFRQDDHRQLTVNADRARVRFDLENKEVLVSLLNPRGSIAGQDSGFAMEYEQIAFPMDEQIAAERPRHMTIARIYERMEEYSHEAEVKRLQRDQEAAMLMLTGNFQQLSEQTIQQYDGYSAYSQHKNRKLNTEIHSRYAMAGSCLFFAFVGGPFAVMQARRQFITSFIMCFLPILLVYYPVTLLMVNLGKSGTVDPAWAMWVPNAILGAAGVWILRRVIQH